MGAFPISIDCHTAIDSESYYRSYAKEIGKIHARIDYERLRREAKHADFIDGLRRGKYCIGDYNMIIENPNFRG